MTGIVKLVIRIVWTLSIVGTCAFIGGAYGWAHHAWLGAVALGTVGFGVGAAIAASPLAFLEILGAGL
ncbi:hypothetical protein RAD16_28225 [Bradyrhizobium sp. 18BD]